MYIPRVGHEVIVEFLEGDPDLPIVTGRVYNADCMPPYGLPAEKTKTTLKSNSSKGGGGFNELRFEDKKGAEQIFLHGEKNLDVRIKNNAYEWIGNDQHLIVKNSLTEHVQLDHHELIDRDHIVEIKRDVNKTVDGKVAEKVTSTFSLEVDDDVAEVFKGNQSTTVTKNHYLKADNIVIEGLTNVTIKVGQSYIAIEAGGIKIGTTGTLEVESTGALSAKSDAQGPSAIARHHGQGRRFGDDPGRHGEHQLNVNPPPRNLSPCPVPDPARLARWCRRPVRIPPTKPTKLTRARCRRSRLTRRRRRAANTAPCR